MEDCTKINENKPFSSKEFSNALNASRVSFAPAELMDEMLGTTTSYMKIKTSQIIETFLPYTKHKPRLIDL